MHHILAGLKYAALHFLSAVVFIALIWFLYRLYKRWTRRCPECESIFYSRWHDREFRRPTVVGKAIAISTTYQRCLNKGCAIYNKDIEVKAYEKEFPLKKISH